MEGGEHLEGVHHRVDDHAGAEEKAADTAATSLAATDGVPRSIHVMRVITVPPRMAAASKEPPKPRSAMWAPFSSAVARRSGAPATMSRP